MSLKLLVPCLLLCACASNSRQVPSATELCGKYSMGFVDYLEEFEIHPAGRLACRCWDNGRQTQGVGTWTTSDSEITLVCKVREPSGPRPDGGTMAIRRSKGHVHLVPLRLVDFYDDYGAESDMCFSREDDREIGFPSRWASRGPSASGR